MTDKNLAEEIANNNNAVFKQKGDCFGIRPMKYLYRIAVY